MSSRIDKIQLNMRDLASSLRRQGRVRRSGGQARQISQKSFGEKPPKQADISKDPQLQHLFSQKGLVGWLEEKIKRASRHPGKIVPAEDITAMAMPEIPGKQDGNLVFLGVDFALKNQDNPDKLAGVLAHEWGHLISDFLSGLDPNAMDWGQVLELRREEESYADAYAGRLLYLIGHKPDGLIEHLKEYTCHDSTKYHDLLTRIEIILRAYQAQASRQELAARIFCQPGERHSLNSRLIAEA